MKLSAETAPRKKGFRKSSEVLVETEERGDVAFNPRRDVPAHLWEEIEKQAQYTSIPELKSNAVFFILRLLTLSTIDEKIKNLLSSREDLIQLGLGRLPIVSDPEKHGITPGYLEETADLLQVAPDLGTKVHAWEVSGSDRFKLYIENQLDSFNDYLYWSKQPKTKQLDDGVDPKQSLSNGLRGSVAIMRLFPAGSSELKTELMRVMTPTHLLNEAKKFLLEGEVEYAAEILAYARILFPEQTEEYKELFRSYWPELKKRLQKESPHHGWAFTTFHATILTAHEIWIDQEGKIVVHLEAPKTTSRKELPERNVA